MIVVFIQTESLQARSNTYPGGILTVADDLLKNDGQKFITMMEQLAESRMAREEDARDRYSSRSGSFVQNGNDGVHNHSHHAVSDEDNYSPEEDGDEEYDSPDEDYEDEEVPYYYPFQYVLLLLPLPEFARVPHVLAVLWHTRRHGTTAL